MRSSTHVPRCIKHRATPSSINRSPTAFRRPLSKAIKHHLAINRAAFAAPTETPPTDVFVLDFDGVVVDSEPEITASAFEAAALRWPDLFAHLPFPSTTSSSLEGGSSDGDMDAAVHCAVLRSAMREVRPALVRGYESMIMLRLLLPDPRCPATRSAILSEWPQLLTASLEAWGESEGELNKVFEAVRNDWMNCRTDSWIALQVPYLGVVQALQGCPFPLFIASSKAASRVSALSSAVLGMPLPPDSPRLFAALLPPEEKKAEALSLIARHPCCTAPTTRLHFVDDRLDTLKAVRQDPDLAGRWNLYLADWGYNTPSERSAAAVEAGIQLLGLPEFNRMLVGAGAEKGGISRSEVSSTR